MYRLWGPHSFLFNGYLGSFRKSAKLIITRPSRCAIENGWNYTRTPTQGVTVNIEENKDFKFIIIIIIM